MRTGLQPTIDEFSGKMIGASGVREKHPMSQNQALRFTEEIDTLEKPIRSLAVCPSSVGLLTRRRFNRLFVVQETTCFHYLNRR